MYLQRQLQAESDKANWQQAKLNMFPNLNASAGHSYNQGRSIDPYSNSPGHAGHLMPPAMV